MKRDFGLKAEPGRINLTGGDAGAHLHAPYTGRTIDVEGGYAAARAWCEALASGADDARWRQRFEPRTFDPVVASAPRSFFRGRTFAKRPASEDFGPPPSDIAEPGRYNEAGSSVLYLTTHVDAVELEVASREGTDLWAQEFRIPMQELRIADLTQLHISSFEAGVLWIAESNRSPAKADPTFRFSRLIAHIISEEFEGMLVPGVRGDEADLLYANLVIFAPGLRWRAWLRAGGLRRMPRRAS